MPSAATCLPIPHSTIGYAALHQPIPQRTIAPPPPLWRLLGELGPPHIRGKFFKTALGFGSCGSMARPHAFPTSDKGRR